MFLREAGSIFCFCARGHRTGSVEARSSVARCTRAFFVLGTRLGVENETVNCFYLPQGEAQTRLFFFSGCTSFAIFNSVVVVHISLLSLVHRCPFAIFLCVWVDFAKRPLCINWNASGRLMALAVHPLQLLRISKRDKSRKGWRD